MIIQVWYARISQKSLALSTVGLRSRSTEKSQDRIVNIPKYMRIKISYKAFDQDFQGQ